MVAKVGTIVTNMNNPVIFNFVFSLRNPIFLQFFTTCNSWYGFSSRLFSFANPHIWQIQIIDMYFYQKKVARKLKSKRLHFLCYKSYFISVPVILTTAASTYLSYSLSLHVAARVRTQLKTLIEKVQRSLKLPHFLCTFFRTSKQNISS